MLQYHERSRKPLTSHKLYLMQLGLDLQKKKKKEEPPPFRPLLLILMTVLSSNCSCVCFPRDCVQLGQGSSSLVKKTSWQGPRAAASPTHTLPSPAPKSLCGEPLTVLLPI